MYNLYMTIYTYVHQKLNILTNFAMLLFSSVLYKSKVYRSTHQTITNSRIIDMGMNEFCQHTYDNMKPC